MFEQKCRIKDITKTLTGEDILAVVVPKATGQFYDKLFGKDLRIMLKVWREKRSLDANAYFHVLVGKIAECTGVSFDDVKVNMVFNYGTVMRDDDDAEVFVKTLSGIDIRRVYKYAQWIGSQDDGGQKYDCYAIYERTHNYDTKQMARLIEGTADEAQNLGIDTLPPEERDRMVSLWQSEPE